MEMLRTKNKKPNFWMIFNYLDILYISKTSQSFFFLNLFYESESILGEE